MSLVRLLAGLAIATAGILACGSDPAGITPVPTSMVLSTNTVSFNALGASQQLTATIRDQNGDAIAGLAAAFISSNPAVATASSSGLVTAVGNGSSTITVSHGTLANQTIAIAVAQVVAEVAKTGGDDQSGLVNAQLTNAVEVEIRDARGHPVPGGAVPNTTVQFVAASGGSVGTSPVLADANGRASTTWTLGPGVGAQQLTASIQGGPASTIFNANAAATIAPALVKVEGDLQTGLTGAPANVVPAVKVQDELGLGVSGASVTFAVIAGSGGVTGGSVTSDANGIARPSSWTIGSGNNTLEVTSGALPAVTFTATGEAAQYDIDIQYYGAQLPTASQQAAFDAAEAKWESIIFGELMDIPLNLSAGTACGSAAPDLPAINETVDELLIYAKVAAIDGPGQVIGQAGPCRARTNDTLPVMGFMVFDSADLAQLEADGQLELVILHEMGHVIGIGSLWNQAGFTLLSNPCPSPVNCTTDPHFNGARARAAFNAVGGTAYVGQRVPVEDCVTVPGTCGAGTIHSHWRESVLTRELMSGYLDAGANLLSILSAGSLLDMGYKVTYSASDAYTMPGATPGVSITAARGSRSLGNDVVRMPLYLLNSSGQVVRVLQP